MTKSPRYPIAPADAAAGNVPENRQAGDGMPPRDLYAAPSFKHRHEVREPLESSQAAHRRAYPEFYRPLPPRMRRRLARRGG
jgi:hypothetical protein